VAGQRFQRRLACLLTGSPDDAPLTLLTSAEWVVWPHAMAESCLPIIKRDI
jgi:hypothetical protein